MPISIKAIKELPDAPGVYFFKKGREILYVGKATSLKDRVKSYFNNDLLKTRGPKLVKVLEDLTAIDWQKTDSVLEALMLEAYLIKKHQPRGNSIGKDDKSYNFVVFTKEDFPALKLVRGHDLSQMDSVQFKYVYGPFPHGLQLKKALKIIRKIFPYRDEKCKAGSGKPCFNRQIGLCPGVCDGSIGKREYAKIIRNLKLFFEGKKGQLLKTLNSEMQSLAKEEKFEEAQEIKRQLFALNHIQDVALIKSHTDNLSGDTTRIEGYDVAHMSGQNRVGVMVVVENAEAMKSEYRKFNIKTDKQGDTDALREILERRFTHSEWPLPKLIVVDGGVTQENIAKKVLEEFGYKISIVAVTKNASHKPINLRGEKRIIKKYEMDILLANSEAHRFSLAFHKKKRSRLV